MEELLVTDLLDRLAQVLFPSLAEPQGGGHPEDSFQDYHPVSEGLLASLPLGLEGDLREQLLSVPAGGLPEDLDPALYPSAAVVRAEGGPELSLSVLVGQAEGPREDLAPDSFL